MAIQEGGNDGGADISVADETLIEPVSALDYVQPVKEAAEDLSDRVWSLLMTHFPVQDFSPEPVIKFEEIDAANPDTLYAAFIDDAEATLQLVAAISGVPIKTANRRLGIAGLHSVEDIDGLTHKDQRIRAAVPFYAERLPDRLPLSATLQTVRHRFIVEYRRSLRQDFEREFKSRLEMEGVPLMNSKGLAGRPDLAIPNQKDEPVVVGEMRKMTTDQLSMRFNEFQSEVKTLNEKHPSASVIVIFDCFEDALSEQYENYVAELREYGGDDLYGVYHASDFDRLVTELGELIPIEQRSLSDYGS